jgi:hypothetical protein
MYLKMALQFRVLSNTNRTDVRICQEGAPTATHHLGPESDV